MKKVNKTPATPPGLAAFFAKDAVATWESFRGNDPNGHRETQDQLRQDQRNVCAYCEIDLHDGNHKGHADFRVEHFHPKKRPPPPPPNRDLDWTNLLAVCSGGNVKDIGDKKRYTNPDYSCDEPKKDKVLTGLILNPLTDVPAYPPLFEFNEDGEMVVDTNCPAHLQAMADRTIAELRLSAHSSNGRIPAERLSRLRKGLIDGLRSQLMEIVAAGQTEAQAAAILAEVSFSDDPTKAWPAFFSTIRWYLGPSAEARLHAIGYDG